MQNRTLWFLSSILLFVAVLETHAEAQEKANRSQRPAPIGVGDGVTDDTSAIQDAVNRSVGVILLSKGTYRITRPIVVDLDKVSRTSLSGNGVARVVMDGPGPAFRFIGTHEGTASPSTFERETWDRQSSPMVDGLEIVGNHPESSGIEATGTMQLTLTRVVIREARHGVHLHTRNRNVTLSECHIYNNSGIGVYLDRLNLHQINIANCHISYNDGGGVVSTKSQIRNLQIGTCDIEGNMGGPGSKPTANVLLDSTDSSIGEVTIVGCTIQHSHDAPNSANIRFNGNSDVRPFTEERRHGNLTIADNVLSDVQCNIEVIDARAVTITGNTMWKGYANNMVVKRCKNVVVSGNVFDRNPRYHYGDGAQANLGIIFTDCEDSTLANNHLFGLVHGDAAIVLRNCKRFNVDGCTILDYGKCGLLLDNVSHSRVSDCLIRDDRPDADGQSIRMIGSEKTPITDCVLSHSGD